MSQQERQSLSGLETVAVKRLIHRLSDLDGDDASVIDHVDAAVDRVERIELENRNLEERIHVLEANLTSQQSGKFQKHAQILEFADNKRAQNQSGVAIVNEDVVGCVGCSRKYAYDLMEGMAETYSFATLRNHTDIPGRSTKLKAVLIEFGEDDLDDLLDRVHSNEGSN